MANWESCPAVESVPGRVSGNWVFKGTRLPVYALFENLAERRDDRTTLSSGSSGVDESEGEGRRWSTWPIPRKRP